MPNLKLTDLASFKAYFESIALSHVDIGGFIWGDSDVIRNNNRSNVPSSILITGPYDNVRYAAPHNDSKVKIKQATIIYMKPRTSEKFADQHADLEFCEGVIEQIIAKLDLDKRGNLVNGAWEMIVANIASITTGPVEKTIGSTRYIGWEMKIDIMENTNLAYDASKWI
jgi:hypothetical protein